MKLWSKPNTNRNSVGWLTDPITNQGAPTYFRYDIEKARSGQSVSPGSAHAVLYSLQRTGGRFCDFKTYTDTEVRLS